MLLISRVRARVRADSRNGPHVAMHGCSACTGTFCDSPSPGHSTSERAAKCDMATLTTLGRMETRALSRERRYEVRFAQSPEHQIAFHSFGCESHAILGALAKSRRRYSDA